MAEIIPYEPDTVRTDEGIAPTLVPPPPLHFYTFHLDIKDKMRVQVNNQATELPAASTLQTLADSLELAETGIAIAVNNQLITRAKWTEQPLQENDQVVVIKAACGG